MIFNPWTRGHCLETKANKTYTKYPEQTINFFIMKTMIVKKVKVQSYSQACSKYYVDPFWGEGLHQGWF